MTKSVRIENADMSAYKVVVYVEELNPENIWVRTEESYALPYPTSMVTHTLWDRKRLVIEEVK